MIEAMLVKGLISMEELVSKSLLLSRIKKIVDKHGGPSKVERATGIPHQTINAWIKEKDPSVPKSDVLGVFASRLGESLNYIVYGAEVPSSQNRSIAAEIEKARLEARLEVLMEELRDLKNRTIGKIKEDRQGSEREQNAGHDPTPHPEAPKRYHHSVHFTPKKD